MLLASRIDDRLFALEVAVPKSKVHCIVCYLWQTLSFGGGDLLLLLWLLLVKHWRSTKSLALVETPIPGSHAAKMHCWHFAKLTIESRQYSSPELCVGLMMKIFRHSRMRSSCPYKSRWNCSVTIGIQYTPKNAWVKPNMVPQNFIIVGVPKWTTIDHVRNPSRAQLWALGHETPPRTCRSLAKNLTRQNDHHQTAESHELHRMCARSLRGSKWPPRHVAAHHVGSHSPWLLWQDLQICCQITRTVTCWKFVTTLRTGLVDKSWKIGWSIRIMSKPVPACMKKISFWPTQSSRDMEPSRTRFTMPSFAWPPWDNS